MTSRLYNRFKTMGYSLVCKLCGCPINILDTVESKAGGLRTVDENKTRSRTPKFYHAECYDSFHLDFDEKGNIYNGLGQLIEKEEKEDE